MINKCIRLLCVLGLLGCLPACAPVVAMIGYGNSAIQLAVQIDRIKLAGDGLSYLGSGKTITDHAVSKLVGADCHLMNVVSPNPVCTAKKEVAQVTRNERINLASVHEDLLNRDAPFKGFAPGATADDGATMNAQSSGETTAEQ